MEKRKLATLRQVSNLVPIEGADNIELAIIDGWQVVVKKNQHTVGELVVYCEIDSFLPIKEEFEFLRSSSHKVMDGVEGFRLKTIKLRGQISQGLVLPVSVVPNIEELIQRSDDEDFSLIDCNVTEELGIVKWEPVTSTLSGMARGNFPSFLHKTDEERIQNLTRRYDGFKQHTYYIAEKLDGSSITAYYNNGVFGVCSRNLDLKESEDNSFWKAAKKYDLENKLKSLNGNYAIQGELIGPGIQGNPYKLLAQEVRWFNLFNIDTCEYVGFWDFIDTMDNILRLNYVPILNYQAELPKTISELLVLAEGKSKLHKDTEREGLVIRSLDRKISFKVISNKFLLKEK